MIVSEALAVVVLVHQVCLLVWIPVYLVRNVTVKGTQRNVKARLMLGELRLVVRYG